MSAEETALCGAVLEWYGQDPYSFPHDVKVALESLLKSDEERASAALARFREAVASGKLPTELPPYMCEHANENPHRCPCDSNCYCKSHTCRAKSAYDSAPAERRYNPIGGGSHRTGDWDSSCRNCAKGRRSHPGGVCP